MAGRILQFVVMTTIMAVVISWRYNAGYEAGVVASAHEWARALSRMDCVMKEH